MSQVGEIHVEAEAWANAQASKPKALVPGTRVLVSVWALVTETGPELTHLQLIELEDQNRTPVTVFLWVPTNQVESPTEPEEAPAGKPS